MPGHYVLPCSNVVGHFSNGWSDIPSKKEAKKKERKRKGEEGEGRGRKERKKREKKEGNKAKGKKERREEEDRMKNRKYLDKRKYCVGTEPSAFVYTVYTKTY